MTPQPDKLEATARELLALRNHATKGPWQEDEVRGGVETPTGIYIADVSFPDDVEFIASAHRMADCIAALLADRAALQNDVQLLGAQGKQVATDVLTLTTENAALQARCEAAEKDAQRLIEHSAVVAHAFTSNESDSMNESWRSLPDHLQHAIIKYAIDAAIAKGAAR